MEPATTTLSRYNVKRGIKLVILILLLAGVRPAFALFNQSQDSQTTTVAASPAATLPADATMASAAASSLEEELPTITDFPNLEVTAALVKELGAAKPLFVYHPSARWPLASVTKLMTAVVALENLGPAAIIPISQEAVDTEGEAGNLQAGQRYTVIDLIRIMLTVSSNDAAMSLARAYDQKQLTSTQYDQELNKSALFTAAMQQKARDLGMGETYYGDPSGLSVVNQSVITDLENLITYVAANHPELLTITRNKVNTVARRNAAGTIVDRIPFTNINEFAGQADFLGGKTGYTDDAGGNLLSLFKYEGKQYLIIVLGTTDRFGQTRALYNWIKEAKQGDTLKP